ncbi:alpha/beta hydrolase [Lentiprolixibacter aurantiacus]|uniref:Alpha/beta hydrolase-fold protein n=1 Tax=Lentiprolixibacter aurantiacus TaxID=2993939 RepID=A0AAE3MJH4_9FLAO|nr:alpha/beta hydrolase-fold protein [Lentiprolixibacter aurantiacus]MCX2718358.1 alpha/beta hydrolase-fold protein [Lentiprolixibacter aurantiacus]
MRTTNTLQFLKVILFALVVTTTIGCQDAKPSKEIPSKFYTDSIYSESLQGYRKHNVYLPKDFDRNKSYPIIYGTDGEESLKDSFIKPALDSLIDSNSIVPVIYIGSHSNTNEIPGSTIQTADGQTFALHYRFFEYVETNNPGGSMPGTENLFANHMSYFKEELISKVESDFNQKLTPEDRIFYGYSNGAGFGANLLNKHPDLIGTFICYSTLGSNVASNQWNSNTKYPDLYLQYGDQETGGYTDEPKLLREKYQESGSNVELKVYEGGHEIDKWNEEFVKTIAEILKP